ncbi:hypothetical protein SSCG_02561 [Streptomyces clavuligerus]|nr:hypothetical protein SSCG_02561 [Streptomyces clavuligerus]
MISSFLLAGAALGTSAKGDQRPAARGRFRDEGGPWDSAPSARSSPGRGEREPCRQAVGDGWSRIPESSDGG